MNAYVNQEINFWDICLQQINRIFQGLFYSNVNFADYVSFFVKIIVITITLYMTIFMNSNFLDAVATAPKDSKTTRVKIEQL